MRPWLSLVLGLLMVSFGVAASVTWVDSPESPILWEESIARAPNEHGRATASLGAVDGDALVTFHLHWLRGGVAEVRIDGLPDDFLAAVATDCRAPCHQRFAVALWNADGDLTATVRGPVDVDVSLVRYHQGGDARMDQADAAMGEPTVHQAVLWDWHLGAVVMGVQGVVFLGYSLRTWRSRQS